MPEEEILRGLLRNGRAAAYFGDVVGVLDRGAQLAEVDAAMDVQKRASSAAMTVRGRIGAIALSGAQTRSTRSPEARRHSISVETGFTT